MVVNELMGVGERKTQKQRRKMPSFSSSLLDAIYQSIDDPPPPPRRNAAAHVDEEIESLRRAIMVEKWMENYNPKSMHLPSNSNSSSSSTDSCIFTPSETESSTTPKPKPDRFTRTKSKALKIYGDLKKVKEPISPGGRIANFLNSIFSPRNLKKDHSESEWSSVRKSRSMKDTTTTSSRSCFTSNNNSNSNPSRNVNKSKRSVRFCPVDDSRIYGVGSRFIKKNMDAIRVYENEHTDFDDKSCASSDLFELENVGPYDQELPVYGTTDLKINRAIASGFIR